jgi:hypothetical protein
MLGMFDAYLSTRLERLFSKRQEGGEERGREGQRFRKSDEGMILK